MTIDKKQVEAIVAAAKTAIETYLADKRWPPLTAIACHPEVGAILRPAFEGKLKIQEMAMLKATNVILASGIKIIDIVTIEE